MLGKKHYYCSNCESYIGNIIAESPNCHKKIDKDCNYFLEFLIDLLLQNLTENEKIYKQVARNGTSETINDDCEGQMFKNCTGDKGQ